MCISASLMKWHKSPRFIFHRADNFVVPRIFIKWEIPCFLFGGQRESCWTRGRKLLSVGLPCGWRGGQALARLQPSLKAILLYIVQSYLSNKTSLGEWDHSFFVSFLCSMYTSSQKKVISDCCGSLGRNGCNAAAAQKKHTNTSNKNSLNMTWFCTCHAASTWLCVGAPGGQSATAFPYILSY